MYKIKKPSKIILTVLYEKPLKADRKTIYMNIYYSPLQRVWAQIKLFTDRKYAKLLEITYNFRILTLFNFINLISI